jgi:hypothetical protein
MRVAFATSAGHPGRPNEDFVGAVPGAVVLVDGAGIPDTETICRHGVAWYAHTLGGRLLSQLSRDDESLTETLASGIEDVTALHRHTCDVADPSSPQATVAVLRTTSRYAEWLVLADAYVVLDRGGTPEVQTDPAELTVRAACTAPLDGLDPGTAAYADVLPGVIDDLRSRRNQSGGYWIAKDDATAARHAVTGTAELIDLDAALVLSNGVSRLVDPYRTTSWPGLVRLARQQGPDAVLAEVRAAEERPGQLGPPDDATIAVCTFS